MKKRCEIPCQQQEGVKLHQSPCGWNFRFAKKRGIRCGLRGFGLSYPSLCQDPLRCTHQVGQVSTWPLCPKKRFHVSLRGCTSLPISFLPLFPCHLKDFIFGLDFLCFRSPLCPFPLCYLIGVWDLLFLSANGQGQFLDHLVSCQLDIWEVKTLKHTVHYNSNQKFPGPVSCRIFSTTTRCFVSYCSLLCLITWLNWDGLWVCLSGKTTPLPSRSFSLPWSETFKHPSPTGNVIGLSSTFIRLWHDALQTNGKKHQQDLSLEILLPLQVCQWFKWWKSRCSNSVSCEFWRGT